MGLAWRPVPSLVLSRCCRRSRRDDALRLRLEVFRRPTRGKATASVGEHDTDPDLAVRGRGRIWARAGVVTPAARRGAATREVFVRLGRVKDEYETGLRTRSD